MHGQLGKHMCQPKKYTGSLENVCVTKKNARAAWKTHVSTKKNERAAWKMHAHAEKWTFIRPKAGSTLKMQPNSYEDKPNQGKTGLESLFGRSWHGFQRFSHGLIDGYAHILEAKI